MKTSPLNRSRAATWLALALGLAAVGGTAHAAVIYTSDPGLTITSGGQPILLTGNSGPGAINVTAVNGFTGFPSRTRVTGSDFNYTEVAFATLANLDDVIDVSTAGWSYETDTLDNGTHYFGISFLNGGTTNYGWMQLTSSGFGDTDASHSITVNAYAYDNTGASIRVGATTSAVPETSTSFGLLALGAGGLLTRRRLKRAAWTV
jgi:hypothetical protein